MNVSAVDEEWLGKIAFAPMIALFCGRGGLAFKHQTVAHKVIVGLSGARSSGLSQSPDASVVVPAGALHGFDARGRDVVIAYLDSRHFSLHEAKALATKWERMNAGSASMDCLREDIDALAPRSLPDRVSRSVAALLDHATIPAAARSVGLSESRFSHVISETLGASPQVWRRWLRLRHAVDLVANGLSVTHAAYDAGFSDSAHFSRTCANALGIRPSAFKAGNLSFMRSEEPCDLALI